MAPRVIGVRFREASKIYHFAPPDYPLHASDYVVVDTPMGLEMGRVVTVPEDDDGDVPPDTKPVVRLADQQDRDAAQQMRDRAEQMLERTRQLIVEHGLEMYAAAFQINLSGANATCYFQANGPVDFRAAVEALEAEFGLRLQMKHAGARDRAKLVDGHDICGLRLCCSSWMTEFPKVGVRMAKEQQLALNPDKISGVCGRLLCCLTFEYDVYREMRGVLPKVGKKVSTPAGMGRVIQVNVLKETATIALDDSPQRVEVPAKEMGMAVRTEEQLNQALIDTPGVGGARGDAVAKDRVAKDTATETAEPDATAASTGQGEAARAPARRRRRRRGRGGAQGAPTAPSTAPSTAPTTAPDSAPTTAPDNAASPPSDAPPAAARQAGAAGETPRRRRRRRRRRSGDGDRGREGDAGGSEKAPDPPLAG